MFKLAFACALAFGLPLLYAAASRAEVSGHYDHHRAWTQTSDSQNLTAQEQQRLRLRQAITDTIGQMYDMSRMYGAGSTQVDTINGLIRSANLILDAANSTGDYYALESYAQQVAALRQALQVVVRL